jgi:hypothetical protein
VRSLFFDGLPQDRFCRGKRLREARFERRSSLPVSAACVVANGIRETLTALLGAPALVRLFEPVIPDPCAWEAVVRNAMLYRVRGSVADAVVVVRAGDAGALASAVFNEPPNRSVSPRELSPIECDVLDRIANAIAANVVAVCGAREAHPVERIAAIGEFVTFFELLVERPVEARVGIALSRDPSPEPRGGLELAHIADLQIHVVASLDLGHAWAATVAGLAMDAILPIDSNELRRCSLAASGRRLARGTCGVRNGRFAIAATSSIRGMS